MNTSIIITILNEDKTIEDLLSSILAQVEKPEEVIIVDGGSDDKTVKIAEKYQNIFRKHKINLRIFVKKGNRSVGRNEAIRRAKNEIIAITDAGCMLDKDWLKNITDPFKNDKEIEVVAGYYSAEAKTVFEKCVVPYVLVMSDRVNPENFLPATRSMAIKKETWKRVGGFPEKFSDNEDYVFANILKRQGVKIFFERKAIVFWLPRKNLKEFYKMVFRFAKGDARAGLRKLKTLTYFLRYFIFFLFLIFAFSGKLGKEGIIGGIGLFIFYIIWSILKNYRYVRDLRAVYILPVLQIASDFAIITGSIKGYVFRK